MLFLNELKIRTLNGTHFNELLSHTVRVAEALDTLSEKKLRIKQ